MSLDQAIATKMRSLTKKVPQASFYSHRATAILNSQLQLNWTRPSTVTLAHSKTFDEIAASASRANSLSESRGRGRN
jgi:hypothetical protein